MSLSESGNGMVMPVSPMYGGYSNGGFGNWGGDGGWWLLLLLFALGGNWGGFGGFGGGEMTLPYMWNTATQNDVNRGFDTASLSSQLSGIQTSISNGFASAEVADCNRAMNAMQTAYTNQIASMNQNFANAQALDTRLTSMEMAQQNCCCENRASIADLKYTVATENCVDRYEAAQNTRDIIDNANRNNQAILDKLCALELDAKNDKINDLERQLTMANLAASQTAQTGVLLADNARQTTALEQYLNPVPIPAYVVQNPNCCTNNWNGCGCGSNF